MPGSRSRLSHYRIPLFAVAVVALVGVGVASVLGVAGLRESNAWTEHTYQVIHAIEVTDRAVRATEANARAYRLTGHPEFRSQFLAALPGVDAAAARLVALVEDDPAQTALAHALRDAANAHAADLRRLYDLQELEGAEAARQATDAAATLRQWSAIETAATQLRRGETRMLQDRKAHAQRQGLRLTAIVVSGTVLSALLMGMLMWNVVRENSRVRALERKTRQASQEMAGTMRRIDRLSRQRHALSRYSGMLQSCETRDEILRLTGETIHALVPGVGGECYLFRASQDFYEIAATFGDAPAASADSVLPNQCWALRRGQPHLVPGGQGPRCDHLDVASARGDMDSLCMPLAAQGTALGLLHVALPADGDHEIEIELLGQVAEQLGLAVANLQLRETLRTQSLRDPLTGLFNRRYLEVSLSRELHRCERRQLPLSVLMLDVDHFKRFNDTHGHAAGDALLAQVGRLIQSTVRAEDFACRYGGEEFTVVMPELDAAGACTRAEQIRRAIGMATVQHAGQTLGPVTVSIGIATFPGDGTTPELLMQVADTMLYRAKAAGRDRVLHASQQG